MTCLLCESGTISMETDHQALKYLLTSFEAQGSLHADICVCRSTQSHAVDELSKIVAFVRLPSSVIYGSSHDKCLIWSGCNNRTALWGTRWCVS